MAGAYATFAAAGQRCDPYFVAGVDDADGEELYRNDPSCEEVFDAEVSATVTGMLESVVEDGTGTRAAVDGVPVAGKTGTTQDWRDAWFTGYSGGEEPLVASVWVGHEVPEPLEGVAGEDQVTGGSLPADMFSHFMAGADEERSTDGLHETEGPDSVSVPDLTGSDIDAVLEGSEEVASASDPAHLLDLEGVDGPSGGPEHRATEGFKLHLVVYEVSDWRPAGEVLEQSLDGGTDAPAASLVALAVSDGDGELPAVPDVVGLEGEEATDVLEDAGYEVDTGETDVDVVIAPIDPEGFAEAQDDPESAAAGDVSDDAVPDIDWLDELPDDFGFVAEPEADGGTILEQDPAAGEPLEPGETVRVQVARLNTELEMPEVELEEDDESEPADEAEDESADEAEDEADDEDGDH